MPCNSGMDGWTPSVGRDEVKSMVEKAVGVTVSSTMIPLLCSACRALERLGYDFDENPALSVWWAGHKAEDDRRAAAARLEGERMAYRAAQAQQAMAKPLNQLTDEEKTLLREEGFLS